ncbi:MAG: long-chain fatty acid--CoA ligase [Myxococcales bacterium]|nr:long-chain fatty acid--CoA ligase [Myxococcales bacterium]
MDAPQSVAAMFFAQARRHHDRPLLHAKREGHWSAVRWDEAAHAVANVAARLVARGLAPGARVALLAENRPEWLLADLACLAVGLVDVPLYPTSPAGDVVALLQRSGAEALFVSDAAQWSKVAPALAQLPRLKLVIHFGHEPLAAVGEGVAIVPFREFALSDPVGGALDHSAAQAVKRRLAAVREGDVATILYTSGTTGAPKGVMLSHGNLLSNCAALLKQVPLGPDDRTLSFLPLSHCFERTAGHYLLLMAGGSIAYASAPDKVVTEVREMPPTLMLGVPRFFEKVHDRILGAIERAPRYRRALFQFALRVADEMAAHTAANHGVLPLKLRFRHELAQRLVFSLIRQRLGGRLRLFVSGGAPLDPELVRFFGRLGLPLIEGYGLTETAPVVSVNVPDRIKPGSVGRPLPDVAVTIAPDGEILVRGPNVMKGYFEDAAATTAVLDPDGTLHTGDIGHLDQDGDLFVTDRKKELIIGSGGKNVAPARIEGLLKRHRIIGDICLIGDRRPYLVALVVADEAALKTALQESGEAWTTRDAVIAQPAVRARFAAAIEQVNGELAPPERIRRFLLVPEPFSPDNQQLTPTLKVRRREVESRWHAEIDALYAAP